MIGLDAVIVAITDEQPRVLTVSLPGDLAVAVGRSGAQTGPRPSEALPSGPLDPAGDRTLDLALRRWVRAAAGIELGYVEQLYTFGDRFRDPRELGGGARMVSVAYLALVTESAPATGLSAQWQSVYSFLPWEDWRTGRPRVVDDAIAPVLRGWIDEAGGRAGRERRAERVALTFGIDGGLWNGELVLERYELLYQLGLVVVSPRDGDQRDGPAAGAPPPPATGHGMAFDHRRILATALGRIRGKIRYRPVVFELVAETFTLLQLQRAVEALAGIRLHKQNFRRLVEQGGGLVEGTGRMLDHTGGRPAELFRFRREVLLERPAPGVGLPAARRRTAGRRGTNRLALGTAAAFPDRDSGLDIGYALG
jgi:hypothetical protein